MTKYDANAYKVEMTALGLTSPAGKKLAAMGIAEMDTNLKAEIMCMCLEMHAFEKKVCRYCKGLGHQHAVCPLFARLHAKFRGDRDVNKLRGKKSVMIRRESRKTLRVVSKRKINKPH